MNAKQDDRQRQPLAVVLLSIHLYFIEVCYFPRVAKLLNRQQDRIRGFCARHIDCNSPLRQVRPGVGIGSERWLFRHKGLHHPALRIAGLRLLRKIGLREVADFQVLVGVSVILILYIFVIVLRNIRSSRYLLEGSIEEVVKGPAT